MGNVIIKRFSTGNNSFPTPKIAELSYEQIKIIKKTWAIPSSKPHDSAERIFYAYLECFPINQQIFQAFRNTPLLMLKGTPGFRAHASRIFNVLSSVVDALDRDQDLRGIKKIVAEVGRSHARRHVTKRAYNELRVVFLKFLANTCHLDDEGDIAWNQLLDIIYHILFECIDGRSDCFLNQN